jgi:uncharacterized protein DUF6804
MSLAFSIARFAAGAIAFYAIAKHPHNFYVLTRWIVFLVCCWGFWICRNRIWPSFAPAYIAIGLVFNPLFPFHFQRSNWHVLDAVAGTVLLASVALHRPADDSINPKL